MGLFNVFKKSQGKEPQPFPDDDLNFHEPNFQDSSYPPPPPPPGMAPEDFDRKMASFESQQFKRAPRPMQSELQSVKDAVGEPDFPMDQPPLPEFERGPLPAFSSQPSRPSQPLPSFEDAIRSMPQQKEAYQLGQDDQTPEYEKFQEEHAHDHVYEDYADDTQEQMLQEEEHAGLASMPTPQEPESTSVPSASLFMPQFSTSKQAAVEPLFVNENEYKSVLRELATITRDSADAEHIVAHLGTLQSEMYPHLEIWQKQYEDIHKKLIFIDKTLFEKKH